MGVTFLVTAFLVQPPFGVLLKGTFVPTLPPGSSLFVLGLIGTTVVPYNLFLGSGIAAGQKLGELRFGLCVAILLGGLISMGILIVGTAVTGSFSFQSLSEALSQKLGDWARILFALGLFAAGFSSAITAPLAAAITARGLFGSEEGNRWHETGSGNYSRPGTERGLTAFRRDLSIPHRQRSCPHGGGGDESPSFQHRYGIRRRGYHPFGYFKHRQGNYCYAEITHADRKNTPHSIRCRHLDTRYSRCARHP